MRAGMKKSAIMVSAALLGGCAAGATAPRGSVTPPRITPVYSNVGLDQVMGRDATQLNRLFGQPDAEYREGTARKLQYSSGICVLDAYLYPKGNSAPVVTWIDTRENDGSPIDRASCVAALSRRGGGK